MPVHKKTEFVLDTQFDPVRSRHYLNGRLQVLHCHHYATLYTQLARDCSMLDGKRLLAECAEDTFYGVLRDYYVDYGIDGLADRLAIAGQYYSVAGLGALTVACAGEDGGEVELSASHIDQGWIRRWGNDSEPVNYITAGFIAAVFAAAFDRGPRSYEVSETASIVSGTDRSQFVVTAR